MKSIIGALLICLLLCLGSFAALVLADQRLGVPLPYSVPIAFGSMLVIGPALFLIGNAIRRARPIYVKVTPIVRATVAGEQIVGARPAPRRADGVVLLDFSKADRFRGHAA